MKIGIALVIFADIIKMLKGANIIDEYGDFRTPTANEDAVLVTRVARILEDHGVDVPDQVDKILQILPLVLSLAGVK